MAQELLDSFTDTNGILVSAHTPEVGSAWTHESDSEDASARAWIQSNRLTGQVENNNSAAYRNQTVFSSAEQTIEFLGVYLSDNGSAYIDLRFARTASNTFYHLVWNRGISGTPFYCRRITAGTDVDLATPISSGGIGGDTLNVYVTRNAAGTSFTVEIQKASDNTWIDPSGTWGATRTVAFNIADTGGSGLTSPGSVGLGWRLAIGDKPAFSAVSVVVGSADATPPTITGPGSATGSASSISTVEGTTAVHTFTANESVTWDLNGGADVAKFSINSSTGALSFVSAPDYDTPTDADSNNTYIVGVRATDGASNVTTQTCTVTVTALGVLNLTDIKAKTTGVGQSGQAGTFKVFSDDLATLVATKTGTVDGGNDIALSDALFVPGTWYRVYFLLANGKDGRARVQAA